MRAHYSMFKIRLLLVAGVFMTVQSATRAQERLLARGSGALICNETAATSPLRDAFRLACLRERPAATDVETRNAIVIGFVGGFVKRNDAKHPEVQFAEYIRDRYPSSVNVAVFSNHQGHDALREVIRHLDVNGDGVLTPLERAGKDHHLWPQLGCFPDSRTGPRPGTARYPGTADGTD